MNSEEEKLIQDYVGVEVESLANDVEEMVGSVTKEEATKTRTLMTLRDCLNPRNDNSTNGKFLNSKRSQHKRRKHARQGR